MFGKHKYWLQFKIINLGISMLPVELRNETLIKNCMKTGHIKVTKEKQKILQDAYLD